MAEEEKIEEPKVEEPPQMVDLWLDEGDPSRLVVRGIGPFTPYDKVVNVAWSQNHEVLGKRVADAMRAKGLPVPKGFYDA